MATTLGPDAQAQLASMPPAMQEITKQVWINSGNPKTKRGKLGVVEHPVSGLPVLVAAEDIRPGDRMFSITLRDTEAAVPIVPELGTEGSLIIPMLVAMHLHPRDASPLWAAVHRRPDKPCHRHGVTQGIPPSEGNMRLLTDEDVGQAGMLFRCLVGARGWESYAHHLAGMKNGPQPRVDTAPDAKWAELRASAKSQEVTGRARIQTNLVLTPFAATVPRTVDPEGQGWGPIEAKRAQEWLAAYAAFKEKRGPAPPIPGTGSEPSELGLDVYAKMQERLSTGVPLPNTFIDVRYFTEIEPTADGGLVQSDTASIRITMIARRHIPNNSPLIRAAHSAEPEFAEDKQLRGHLRTVGSLEKTLEGMCEASIAKVCSNMLAATVRRPAADAEPAEWDAFNEEVEAALRARGPAIAAHNNTSLHAPPFVGTLPLNALGTFKDVTGRSDIMAPLTDIGVQGQVLTPGMQLAMGQRAVASKSVASVVTYLVALDLWLRSGCRVTEDIWASKHSLWRFTELMAASKETMTRHPEVRAAYTATVTTVVKGLADDATPDDVADALSISPDARSWDKLPTASAAKTAVFDAGARSLLSACGFHSLELIDAPDGSGKRVFTATMADHRHAARGQLGTTARARIAELAERKAATVTG